MSKLEMITSRDNKKLKLARKTRDGKIADRIFIEGVRLVEEALRSNLDISEAFFTKKFAKSERGKVIHAVVKHLDGVDSYELTDELFASIADTEHPQGIALIAHRPEATRTEFESNVRFEMPFLPVVLFLKDTNNPSNLGAVFRTAEAAGVAGIIVSSDSADLFAPKSLRAAMGSCLRVPAWTGASFDEARNWAAERRMIITATDLGGEVSYLDIDWRMPRLLLFGSEAHGLGDIGPLDPDESINIPMKNEVESLNLAVSCGILLFEARRAIERGGVSQARP